MKMVNETSALMGDKPVIVLINTSNQMIFTEFESNVNGIVVHFGVQNQTLLDIVSGNNEPSGLLPFQMPSNMTTVELQNEDVPQDMECYVDSEGNKYNFAFGLNWDGIIIDERTKSYK